MAALLLRSDSKSTSWLVTCSGDDSCHSLHLISPSTLRSRFSCQMRIKVILRVEGVKKRAEQNRDYADNRELEEQSNDIKLFAYLQNERIAKTAVLIALRHKD